MIRTTRFIRQFLRPNGAAVLAEEVSLHVRDNTVDATLYLPAGARAVRGWVALHGMTVPGRTHKSLVRFASALAASGAAVLVPDVPEWRTLRISVAAAADTIEGGAHYLAARPEVSAGSVGAVGFSFGATQALIAAADPRLRELVGTVVGFGGYCDLRRAIICMITGEHEWGGRRYALDPDPYGRWIVAANYLTQVPEYAGFQRVGQGLHALAEEAGRRGFLASAPEYDPSKASTRQTLSAEERPIWDFLAPPHGTPTPDVEQGRRLAHQLADAALATEPQLDPRPVLSRIRSRIVLAHGYEDQLIPFTESLRLRSQLPAEADPSVTITRLFAHSVGAAGMHPLFYAREAVRFFRLLHRAIR
jgi:hypothetical protein